VNLNAIQKLGEDFNIRLRTRRRQILKDLVSQIEAGKFWHSEIDPNQIYLLHQSVRHEYQKPFDIDWGAGLRASEIDATYEKG